MSDASTIGLRLPKTHRISLPLSTGGTDSVRLLRLGTAGLLNCLHFANDGLQSALLMMVTLVSVAIGLSQVEVGFLTSAHFFMSVVLALPAGLLARRVGGRSVLLGGMIISGISIAALSVVEGFWSMAGVFLAASIGFGMFHPVAFGMLARCSAENETGKSMGTFAACGDVGRSLLSTGVVGLLSLAAWQSVSVSVGLLTLFLCGTLLLLSGESAGDIPQTAADRSEQNKNDLQDVWKLVRANRRFVFVCGLGFLDTLANSSLYIFLPVLLVSKGMSAAELTVLIGVFFWASLLGKIVVSRISDRLGAVPTLAGCLAGLCATMFGLNLLNSFWLLAVLVACLGTLMKGSRPIFTSLTASTLPKDLVEVGFGVNQTIIGVALTVSPLFMGFTGGVWGPGCAFLAAGAISAVTCLLTLATPTSPVTAPSVSQTTQEQSVCEDKSIYNW